MGKLEKDIRRLRSAISTTFPDLKLADGSDISDEADSIADEISVPPVRLVLKRNEQLPSMFDYQSDLARQMADAISVGNRGLLSLPTGGGKTRTAAFACLAAMSDRGASRIVWLAPTRELVDQAIRTVKEIWGLFGQAPDLTITRDGGYAAGCVLWVTTPQAVHERMASGRLISGWDAVVFDEAHQAVAATFYAAVNHIAVHGPASKPVSVIGLSATPGRYINTETLDLVQLFQGRLMTSEFLGENPVLSLQQRGVLARLQFRFLTKQSVALDDEATRIVIAAKACQHIVGIGGHVLVFTGSVAGAVCLSEILNGLGVSAQAVHSEMSMPDRLAKIESFGRLQTRVLANQRLLATGYDCPAVSDVLLLTRIGSPIMFEQMVGRAARGPKTGGSSIARIWQFEDHLALHGLPSSYYRYKEYEWS